MNPEQDKDLAEKPTSHAVVIAGMQDLAPAAAAAPSASNCSELLDIQKLRYVTILKGDPNARAAILAAFLTRDLPLTTASSIFNGAAKISLYEYIIALMDLCSLIHSPPLMIEMAVYLTTHFKKPSPDNINRPYLSYKNIHRFLLTAFLIINKTYDDKSINTGHYSILAGMELPDMKILEVAFLKFINYEVIISPEEFSDFLDQIYQMGLDLQTAAAAQPRPAPANSSTASSVVDHSIFNQVATVPIYQNQTDLSPLSSDSEFDNASCTLI